MIDLQAARSIYQRGRLFMSLVRERGKDRKVPLVANLFLTGRCNGECDYCYVGLENNPNREFSEAQWLALLDDLIDKGTRMFTLVGGEPLISPHCAPIMRRLRERNVFFTLTSNGFLIRRNIELVKLSSQLTISLDGDRDSNDAIRGKGWHDKAMDGIKVASENGIPVRLSVVVTTLNMNQADYILDLCERFNLHATFTPCIDRPEFRREKSMRLQMSDGQVRSFFGGLLEKKKTSSRIMNSDASIRYMIGYPVSFSDVILRSDENAGYFPERCPYGKIQFIITNTGEIYPCGIWWNRPEYKSINIMDDGLDAALDHAGNLDCQSCYFCNLVDWVELSKASAAFRGMEITLRQFFSNGARKSGL